MRQLSVLTIVVFGMALGGIAHAAETTPFEQQLALAGRPGVKISVRLSGWYRVGRAELLRAGLDPKADARMLQLYADGRQVPIYVRGVKARRLTSKGTIEFYGLARNTLTADARTYWLVVGMTPGRRMAVSAPGRIRRVQAPRSFDATVISRERSNYYPAVRNGEEPNSFGQFIRTGVTTVEKILVPQLDRRWKRATLQVRVKGFAHLPHLIKVGLNGADVGLIRFDGQAKPTARFPIAASLLKEGENEVTFTGTIGDTDVSLVDEIRIMYARLHTAGDEGLVFPVHPRKQPRVSGFRESAIRVADVTDPSQPRIVRPSIRRAEGRFAVIVPAAARWRRLVAVSTSQMKRPLAVKRERPSNWYTAARGADLVIISHADFLASVEPLRKHRESQGFKTVVVDVEDLYDEFSYGAHGPQAIKSFLVRASQRWRPAPGYALLVGDASADPLDLLKRGFSDYVPTKILDTKYSETGSDDWLADFNDDGFSELAVGRLQVRTPAQAQVVISKIIGYDSLQRPRESWDGLLVADANDGWDFEASNRQLAGLFPTWFGLELLVRGIGGDADVRLRSRLLARLNEGPTIVNYFGHGAAQIWTKSAVFRTPDAETLRNRDRLSFYVMTTCNNGYFIDPTNVGLGEALLRAEGGGAAAVWASSGYTEAYEQTILNQELVRQLFAGSNPTLGEATLRAKRVVRDVDIRRTFILHGDPTTRLH